MAWNYQSLKTKEVTSFLYTSTFLLHTQTIGFVTLVSPLCDGRSRQPVSHLLPLTKRKAQERESTPHPGVLQLMAPPYLSV
jgi:hypothetical protein